MEKIEEKMVEVPLIEHKFYCDRCNKYIGTSEENYDGYYEKCGCVKQCKIFYKGIWWYTNKQHLCEECKFKYQKEFEEKLREMGFSPTLEVKE